jgi:hypothetical protein
MELPDQEIESIEYDKQRGVLVINWLKPKGPQLMRTILGIPYLINLEFREPEISMLRKTLNSKKNYTRQDLRRQNALGRG